MTLLNTENYLGDMQSIQLAQNFEDMELKQDLLRGIYSFGLEKPSAVQQKSIVHIINGNDVAVQSQTGTGKTTAFIIGILQEIDPSINRLQALILEPTREISLCIHHLMANIAKFMNVNVFASPKIVPLAIDKAYLKRGTQVLIGTPTAVLALFNENFINTEHLKFFMIDEVDCLISYGFRDQIEGILNFVPKTVQFGLCSSTLITPDEAKVIDYFMRDPIKIILESQILSLEGVKQYSINIENEEWKIPTLIDLIKILEIPKMIIFCNTHAKVKSLAEKLNDEKIDALHISLDMNNDQREYAIRNFKAGNTRVFVTAGKFWRDDNMDQYVYLNYELPIDFDSYIKRIGRKGENARQRIAISFINERNLIEYEFLKNLQLYFAVQIEEMPEDIRSVL